MVSLTANPCNIITNQLLKYLKQAAEFVVFVLLGSFVALGILYFVIASFPVILFRQLVNYIILPCFLRPKYQFTKFVCTGFGTAYAAELLSSIAKSRSSRNAIVVSNVVQGHIPFEECAERVHAGLVKSKRLCEKSNTLIKKFPEMSGYIDSWMGYMFWKNDDHFDINNHLTFHQIPSHADLDEFCVDLFEKLTNKKFLPNRSPWEIHVVHGSKNGENKTVFITQVHHVFGDGLSVTSVGLEGLFGVHLEDYYPKGSSDPTALAKQKAALIKKKGNKSYVAGVFTLIQSLIDLLYDIGCMASFLLWRATVATPFHVPDSKKTWKQLYGRSELISIDKVKGIKNKLGVSLSAVLLSSMSSSIAHFIKTKNGREETKNFLCAAPKLLPGRPMDRFTNFITGTAYKIPVQCNMKPTDRVKECEKIIQRVNPSLFNRIFPFLTYILSFHIAPIAQFGFRSTVLGSSMSNFPGPAKEIQLENGSKLEEIGGAVGGFDSATGVMILIFSYANRFRFSVTAENATMDKDELKKFIKRMEEEINILHEITLLPENLNEAKNGNLQIRMIN